MDNFPYKFLFAPPGYIDDACDFLEDCTLLRSSRLFKTRFSDKNGKSLFKTWEKMRGDYKGCLGECILLERVEDSDYEYEKFGILTDFFSEPERVRAAVLKNGKYVSPFDFWENNKENIMNIYAVDPDEYSEYIEMYHQDPEFDITRHCLPEKIKEMREYIYMDPQTGKKRGEAYNFNLTTLISFIEYLRNMNFEVNNILDFCGGWGDRLMGAIFSEVEKYVVVDPNPNLPDVYRNISKSLDPEENTELVIYNCPFEECNIREKNFNLVFTCPPYFNFEKYVEDENQSMTKYPRRDNWYNNFLLTSTRKAISLLNKGGYLAIAIQDGGYESYTDDYVRDVSKFDTVVYMGVIGYSPEGEGNDIIASPIWLWKKK